MSGISDRQPSEQQSAKPPRRRWEATESFFDLKLSHWVEIALTAALVGIGIGQLIIYSRQATIMATQRAGLTNLDSWISGVSA